MYNYTVYEHIIYNLKPCTVLASIFKESKCIRNWLSATASLINKIDPSEIFQNP